MKKKCLLDLDGVLVDFIKGACELHSKPNPYDDPCFHEFNLVHKFGMSETDFWGDMDYDFWAGLDWMPDGKEILAIIEDCFGVENICICSSPCLTHGCLEGKLTWIEKNIPQYKRRYLFGPQKWFCASRNSWLIDDSHINIDRFIENNGNGILVPRQWNPEHSIQDLSYFRYKLEVQEFPPKPRSNS